MCRKGFVEQPKYKETYVKQRLLVDASLYISVLMYESTVMMRRGVLF